MKPPAWAFQYVNESQLNSISKSLDEFFADIRSWFDVKTGDLKPNVQDFFDQSEDGCEARAWFEERLKTELSDIEDFMRLEQYIGALVATAAALVKDSTRQWHEAAARKFFFEACRGRSSGVVAESHIHLACMLGFLESFLFRGSDAD